MGFVERRKYVRFDVECNINVQVVPAGGISEPSDIVSSLSKNLSMEGICFVSEKAIDPGSLLKVEIFVDEQKQALSLQGEVVWNHEVTRDGKVVFEVGVKLFTIEKGDENKFMGYVSDMMSKRLRDFLRSQLSDE